MVHNTGQGGGNRGCWVNGRWRRLRIADVPHPVHVRDLPDNALAMVYGLQTAGPAYPKRVELKELNNSSMCTCGRGQRHGNNREARLPAPGRGVCTLCGFMCPIAVCRDCGKVAFLLIGTGCKHVRQFLGFKVASP